MSYSSTGLLYTPSVATERQKRKIGIHSAGVGLTNLSSSSHNQKAFNIEICEEKKGTIKKKETSHMDWRSVLNNESNLQLLVT